jgi:hypothetical protein
MKLKDLSRANRKVLANKAKTSIGTLDHIASGVRKASAEMAGIIENAALKLGWDIRRESLCAACKGCELAKIARARRVKKDDIGDLQ